MRIVEGEKIAGADFVALEGDLGRCNVRHGGLVRRLGRVFGNEAAVGRGLVEIGRGAGRIGHGTARGRAGGDKRWRICKKVLASGRCLSIGRR